MKKYAATAAAIAVVALSGCGTIDVQPKTWQTGESHRQAAPAGTVRLTLAEHVQARWTGPNVPDAHWIETTALIICKRDSAGLEIPEVIGGVHGERNSDLVVAAAMKIACPR